MTDDDEPKPTLLRMREGKPGGGKGPLLSEDQSLTLTSVPDVLFVPNEPHAVEPVDGWQEQKNPVVTPDGTAPTLSAAAGQSGNNVPILLEDRPVVIRTTGEYANPTVIVDDLPMLAANPMSDREMVVAYPDEAMAIRTAFTGAEGFGLSEGVAHTLDQGMGQAVAVPPPEPFSLQQGWGNSREAIWTDQVTGALSTMGDAMVVTPPPIAFKWQEDLHMHPRTDGSTEPLSANQTMAVALPPSPTPPSSQASEGSTSGSTGPDGAPSHSRRSSPTPAPSSPDTGPTSPTSGTSSSSPEDQRPWAFDWTAGNFEPMRPSQEMTPPLKVGTRSPAVAMPSSPEPPSGPVASHARISPWPGSGSGSGSPPASTSSGHMTPDQGSPTPSSTSSAMLWGEGTPLSSSSSRTYRDFSPVMRGEIWRRSSVAWQTSGMAWLGGCSTLSSSECPSGDADASWSGCDAEMTTLMDVLLPSAPQRYSLSGRAAAGIIRRSVRRGRDLPPELGAALRVLAKDELEANPLVEGPITPPAGETSPQLSLLPWDTGLLATTRTTSSSGRSPAPSPTAPTDGTDPAGMRLRTWWASMGPPRDSWSDPSPPESTVSMEPPRDSEPDTTSSGEPSGARTESRTPPSSWTVRRLTPTECERLMGYPDGWTVVPTWRPRTSGGK